LKRRGAIGDVLVQRAPGCRSDDEITVFDSSGIALQDLCVVDRILARAVSEGAAKTVGENIG
jgi:ornithine cyclodeaminase/alanine dehydrogenase-like protein (mu-crystallin family)